MRISYQPAFDESDEVIGISVAVLDVTDSERVEDKLTKTSFLDTKFSESSERLPWNMDAEGNSLEISSQWVRTTTLNKSQTKHLGWLEAVHPDDLGNTIKTMKDALRTGEPIDIHYRIKDLDGEWKWMRSQGSPRFNSNGGIVRWYGTLEEVGPS